MGIRKSLISLLVTASMVAAYIPAPVIAKEFATENNSADYSGYCGYFCTDEDKNVITKKEQEIPGVVKSSNLKAELLESKYNPIDLDNNYLVPIRNQNPFGTCWAFASVGMAEIEKNKEKNIDDNLSELQLVYFTYDRVTDPLGGTTGDTVVCTAASKLDMGGNYTWAMNSLMTWQGVADEEEADLKYSNASKTYLFGLDNKYAYGYDVAHLKNTYEVDIKNDKTSVKNMIKEYGAVGISYFANVSGAYNSTYNSYFQTGQTVSNHAVLVVGWDDNFSANNFNTKPSGNGAWLVRNSWGSDSYSERGYFWLSYYDTGLQNKAYVYDYSFKGDEDYYDNNYCYDGALESIPLILGSKANGANVFTVKNDKELLKAVSIYVNNPNNTYTVSIYKDLTNESNPTSGTLVATKIVPATYEGYYTVELDETVMLNKNSKFSVVETVTGSSTRLIFENTAEVPGMFITKASLSNNQSFVLTANGWTDVVNYGGTTTKGNLRIKAYTNTVGGESDVTTTAYQYDEASEQTVTNMVVFTRFADDSLDAYNTLNNWKTIRGLFDKNVASGAADKDTDNSFKKYIHTISEGKLEVINLFPQQNIEETGINTYTLKYAKEHYTDSSQIVDEIVNALSDGAIKNQIAGIKLDNISSGVLDNLTVIIQEDIQSETLGRSHHSTYAANTKVKGLYVRDYNFISSACLVKVDGSLCVAQQQGVIAHEFLHTLGLSDLYRYNNSDTSVPVGMWDIMAANTSMLQYPLGFEREQLGYITSTPITENGTYTLTAVSGTGGNKLFVIKTPMSDSESIYLEYRKKDKSSDYHKFERSIPSSGLLMYRVNSSITSHTNSAGEDYIYVYRPETAGINGAAIDVSANETGYGSTDLSVTEDVLTYADGTNSGIAISNAKLSADGNTLTFDVSFAEYGNNWQQVGSSFSGSLSPEIVVDEENGSVYTAYINDFTGYVKKWNGTAYENVATTIGNVSDITLKIYNNKLYLGCLNQSGNKVTFYVLGNNTWIKQTEKTSSTYINAIDFIQSDSGIYALYIEGRSTGSNVGANLINIESGEILFSSLDSENLTNPSACIAEGNIYIIYSDIWSDNRTKIIKIDSDKNCTDVFQFDCAKSSIHSIKFFDGKIYGFAAGNDIVPETIMIDGTTKTKNTIDSAVSVLESDILELGGNVYITYCSNNKEYIYRINNNDIALIDSSLSNNITGIDIIGYDGMVYAAYTADNGSFIVKKRSFLESTEIKAPTITVTGGGSYYVNQTNVKLKVSIFNKETTGTYTYQWFAGDNPISGAVNDTYTPPVGTAGTTTYYCKVTYTKDGKSKSTKSDAVTLILQNVAVKPELVILGPSECVAGSSVNNSVEIKNKKNYGTYIYQWYFNSKNSIDGASKLNGFTEAKMNYNNLSLDGTYYFICRVTHTVSQSQIKTTEISKQINVYKKSIKPIAYITGNDNYTVGDKAVLTVKIVNKENFGNYKYQWYKGDTLISGATGESYAPSTTVPETVLYKCIVTHVGQGSNNSISSLPATYKIVVNKKVVEPEVVKPTAPTKLTSNIASVNETAASISKIATGTLAGSLINNINEKEYMEVRKNGVKVDTKTVLATGMTACLIVDGKVTKNYSIIVTGDTNGDGKINITDFIKVKAAILGKDKITGVTAK